MKCYQRILPIFFLVLVAACDETVINQSSAVPDFWEEHHQQRWNEHTTNQQLLGSWKWTYYSCCPESLAPIDHANKEMEEVVFQFEPGLLTVLRHGFIEQQASWYIELIDGDLYGLVTEPMIENTRGRILFAEGWVQFNDSYVDGADNIFQKVVE